MEKNYGYIDWKPGFDKSWIEQDFGVITNSTHSYNEGYGG